MTVEREEKLKEVEAEYKAVFGVIPFTDTYTTGDTDRDIAMIKECIRLRMEMWGPSTDTFNIGRATEAERTRLHMLVPA